MVSGCRYMPEEYIYSGEISGYVYLQGHTNHSGATITVWDDTTSYATSTASDGYFTIGSLIDNTYHFNADKTGYTGVTINNIEIINSRKYTSISEVLIIHTPPPPPTP
jgi:hypothetical protein